MFKLSSALITVTALALTAPAALAADVERNDRLYDATGASVAKVHTVEEDGDVLVIYKGAVRRIGAETLSNTDDKLMTSLTRKEIRRMK